MSDAPLAPIQAAPATPKDERAAKRARDARPRIVALVTEAFRDHGFEGASLSLIGEATGLGRGSLYHVFPGGKEDMANAAVDEIGVWFEREVFAPLGSGHETSIDEMFNRVDAYFRTGRRSCLVASFAQCESRAMFARKIAAHFQRWIEALATALEARGFGRKKARARAEEIVAGIQGAIVLARALDDPQSFARVIERLRLPFPCRGAASAIFKQTYRPARPETGPGERGSVMWWRTGSHLTNGLRSA